MPRDQVQQQTTLQKFVEGPKKALEAVKDAVNSPGMAAIHAFIRQGADEFSQILPAFPDSMRTQPEPGQLFEPTPQLITEQMTGRQVNLELDR